MKFIKFYKDFKDERLITEVLGVPQNITNVSREIWEKFIIKVGEMKNLNKEEILIEGEFQVADIKFKNCIMKLVFFYGFDELEPMSFSVDTDDYSIFSKDLKLKSKETTDLPIIVNLTFGVSKESKVELKEHLIKNKVKYISSLAHEIKHVYDICKKKTRTLSDEATYVANSSGYIDIFEDFFHYLYYTENFENLVRSTEITSELEELGITKKGFKKFINSTDAVVTLKKITTFDFKTFYDDLVNMQMKKDACSKEDAIKIVEEQLKKTFENYKSNRTEHFKNMLEINYEKGEITEEFKNNAIKKFEADTATLFSGDYMKFYRQSEKMMKEKATKVLKKIYGLYALAKDDELQKLPKGLKNIYDPRTKL